MLASRQSLSNLSRAFARHGIRALGCQQSQLFRTTTTAANEEKVNNARHFGGIGLAALAGALTAGSLTLADTEFWHPMPVSVEVRKPASKFYSITADNIPPKRPDLPTIPLEQVAEHCEEGDMWYTFRGAVYNMSFFLNGHPGGAPVSYK